MKSQSTDRRTKTPGAEKARPEKPPTSAAAPRVSAPRGASARAPEAKPVVAAPPAAKPAAAKAASKPVASKVAAKAGPVKAPVAEGKVAAPKAPAGKAAPVSPAAASRPAEAQKPIPPARPAASVKAAAPVKPAAKDKAAASVKPAAQDKAAAPARAAEPAKPATPRVTPPKAPAARTGAKRSAPKAAAASTAETSAEPGEHPAREQDPAGLAKLTLSQEALASEPKATTIPWSYGLDRITAAAVDPDRLFTYWEVTDQAIERARARLGPGGPGAWLDLRVYDTTGLIFDGTNAHGYFDHEVDRATRQWFFHVGKPTSAAFVEIGLRSTEGFFVAIARSGRVDFPRRQPAPWRDPEWMTVQPWSGAVADVHRAPAPVGAPGGPDTGGGPADRGLAPIAGVDIRPENFEQLPRWVLREPGEGYQILLRQALEQGWEKVEWQEITGEGWTALAGKLEWESPHVVSSWEEGPFDYPVEIEPPSREDWAGQAFAYRVGGVTHVVHGPWRVVIRNLGAHGGHERVGGWTIYRSWAVEAGQEIRPGATRVVRTAGGSEQLLQGASERRWVAGSELRLAGASEKWRLGASELAYRGASERLFLGASQWVARGASERSHAGASERRLGGASERQYAGGSEGRLGGASDQLHGGGSEPRLAPSQEGAMAYPAVAPATPKGEE